MPGPAARESRHTVTLIEGDGIGPEIAAALVEVFAAAEAPIDWERAEAGLACAEHHGTPLPQSTLESIRRNRLALKGPTTTPIGSGHRSVNVAIRKALDLFASVRPCRSLPGVQTRFENVDVVIVRENIEDTYSGIEHAQTPDVVQGLRLCTRPGALSVAHHAFELAQRDGRSRVTCVHKANIHKMTDGLFLECFRQTARDYPTIQASDILIDNCCMQLVSDPSRFEVLVTPNLFGDILSDLCAGLIGGLGVAPGGNIGHGRAVFEAVHGSAPDIAGRGIANPMALILSGVLMLRHMGLSSCAARIESGLRLALVSGVRTRDLGGNASTAEFTRAVVANLPPRAAEHETAGARTSAPSRAASRLATPSGVVTVARENWVLRGCDVFIAAEKEPTVPQVVGPLKLGAIANRGTRIEPGGQPDVMLVNWFCCRYLGAGAVTDGDIQSLLAEVSRQANWVHVEKLHDAQRDGKAQPRYSAI